MRFRTVLIAAIATICMLNVAFANNPRVVAEVNRATQTMTVSVDGVVQYTWAVSTARPGHVTLPGTFTPYWLPANHYSSLYNTAPMPYSVFYSGNYAVHGTTEEHRLGGPASAGCVRLAVANARIFYELVQTYGMSATRVVVL